MSIEYVIAKYVARTSLFEIKNKDTYTHIYRHALKHTHVTISNFSYPNYKNQCHTKKEPQTIVWSISLCDGQGQRQIWICLCAKKGRKIHFSPTSRKLKSTQIAKFMGPTWVPPGSCRPQMDPMLAPWTLLSGNIGDTKWFRKYHNNKYKVRCIC